MDRDENIDFINSNFDKKQKKATHGTRTGVVPLTNQHNSLQINQLINIFQKMNLKRELRPNLWGTKCLSIKKMSFPQLQRY